MSGLRIKKGDTVIVTAGKDKGRSGEVLKVLPSAERVVVAGVNMVKRHVRPSMADPKGGVKQMEAPIHVSNVAIFNPATKKADRVGIKTLNDQRKARYFKSNGELIDV